MKKIGGICTNDIKCTSMEWIMEIQKMVMIILVTGLLTGCGQNEVIEKTDEVTSTPVMTVEAAPTPSAEVGASGLPIYRGNAYEEMNGNVPWFTEEELKVGPFVQYSPTDTLGRVFVIDACIGKDMPGTEIEEPLDGDPAGWQDVSYDIVEGGSLYHRAYLFGEAEDARNVITITEEADETLTLFKDQVTAYVEETGNLVRLRISPVYEAMNILCDGVILEAMSCEVNGEGLSFCVFVYNEQPGVVIDHVTGESSLA